MDIHLSNSVISGHLTNEIPNLITGVVHLIGRKQPLQVELQGNFLRDIAGCRIDWINSIPNMGCEVSDTLRSRQLGAAGEMTASRRIRHMTKKNAFSPCPTLDHASGCLKNLIFLEWFNLHQQRVILQAWHWTLRVSAPQWTLPREQELAQLRALRAQRRAFLLQRDSED